MFKDEIGSLKESVPENGSFFSFVKKYKLEPNSNLEKLLELDLESTNLSEKARQDLLKAIGDLPIEINKIY